MTALRSIPPVTLGTVLTVFAVSGFAQTNTVPNADTPHASTTAARVYVAARGAAYDGVGVASNLTVTNLYQRIVERMIRRSATFRRQCARIAQAEHLSIEIRSDAVRGMKAGAWTLIRRPGGTTSHATVHVAPGTRIVELIAHEIEHVIEQLDGVDLRHKATLRATGVRACECGDSEMFETDRAISVGQQVAREVEQNDEKGR